MMQLPELKRPIELLLSDVDGVMTDGGLTFSADGIESKTFSVRDGLGVKLWQRAGSEFGIVTGRSSEIVRRRAEELGIRLLKQGVSDKWPVVQEMLVDRGIDPESVAYIGDDLPDLPVIQAVGLGVAVADAAEEVRQGADAITTLPGGRGAVRELVEALLKQSGRWDNATPSAH